MINGLQIRAARGFLAWDRRDLAEKAVVTIYMLEHIETGAEITDSAMVKGVAAIQAALEAEGIGKLYVFDVARARASPTSRLGRIRYGSLSLEGLSAFGGGQPSRKGRLPRSASAFDHPSHAPARTGDRPDG